MGREAILKSTHNLCFEQKYEKISEFLSENYHFLVAKFSIYVFVMICNGVKTVSDALI